MKEEWPHIEAYRHTVEPNDIGINYIVTYTWVGSKYATVWVSSDYRTYALPKLPWPVKVLSKPGDSLNDAYEIVRKDVGWHLWWILVSIHRKLFRSYAYGHFKWRVLKTFEIWGLAYVPEETVLSWRNIGRKHEKKKSLG
jgi:hypothetical protein